MQIMKQHIITVGSGKYSEDLIVEPYKTRIINPVENGAKRHSDRREIATQQRQSLCSQNFCRGGEGGKGGERPFACAQKCLLETIESCWRLTCRSLPWLAQH